MEMTSPMGQGGLFLLQFITGLVIFGLMLRFLLRATHADWRHPIVTFIAKITNPLCAPINKILPLKGRWDWSAIGTAVVIQALFILLVGFLTEKEFGAIFILIAAITEIMNQLLDMLFWLIIIHVVLSWVSPGHNPNTAIFDQLTNPILEPFKRIIPPVAGMDLSPLAAILTIKLVQIMAVGSITQIAQKLMG